MSPVITPDTREAEDMTTQEPGTYKARIESVEPTKSKEKQQQMIIVKCKATKGDGSHFTRNCYVMCEGKGAGNFEQLLRACKLDALADTLRTSGPQPFDTDVLVGQEVMIILDHEEYKGQMRDRINGFLRA